MTSIQIYRYESGKYRFDLQAFKKIINKSKDNLIAIYSMTGPLRMGKSFMLGFFLRYLQTKGKDNWISHELADNFKYRGGSDRDTTGIWIWDKPFDVQRSDGRVISVFLMDTQGCFDSLTSMQDNAIVFTLSTLLSSVMIFNLKRQISEEILQFLQYFAGYARLADNEDNRDEPFQRLMFLIRDWEFPDYNYGLYDDKTSIDGKNYKIDVLNANENQPIDGKFVRQSIETTFEDISVYLMPHPGKDVAVNSHWDLSKVEKEFVTQLQEFVELVLNKDKIIPKRIGGQYITGEELIKYVENWSEIFKCDSIPESKTVFEATAEIQNEMAKCAAIDNYTQNMKNYLIAFRGSSDKAYSIYENNLIQKCKVLFRSFKRLGGKEFENKYLESLSNEIQILSQHFKKINEKEKIYNEMKGQMESKCKELMKEIVEQKQKMEEMKSNSLVERTMFEKRIIETEKSLDECKQEFNKELEIKEENIKGILNQLTQIENQIKANAGGCAIL